MAYLCLSCMQVNRDACNWTQLSSFHCDSSGCPQHKCSIVVPTAFFLTYCDEERQKKYQDWAVIPIPTGHLRSMLRITSRPVVVATNAPGLVPANVCWWECLGEMVPKSSWLPICLRISRGGALAVRFWLQIVFFSVFGQAMLLND